MTESPSSGRSPSLRRRRRRLLARLAFRKQPPAAALHFCNRGRASPPSCSFAPQSCAGGGGGGSGCRCRSCCRIPERFPKRASTGNWQVPSAPTGSKGSQNPLESCFERQPLRGGGKDVGELGECNSATRRSERNPTALILLGVLEELHDTNLARFFQAVCPASTPHASKPANMAHLSSRDELLRMSEGFKSSNTPLKDGGMCQAHGDKPEMDFVYAAPPKFFSPL